MPLIVLATVLTLSALYAPQPLLPAIVADLGISLEEGALLTTASFLPLALSPLAFGYLLEAVPARRLLRVALLLLAVTEVAFFFGRGLGILLAIRVLQGCLIPAALTALMTYVSRTAPPSRISGNLAVYVAATILGGFLGRAGAGLLAELIGWRAGFLVLGASLLTCAALLRRLPAGPDLELARPRPGAFLEILRRPLFLRTYGMIFCLFWSFAAVMNFIPFRMVEIRPGTSDLLLGLMYAGYLAGLAAALGAVSLCRLLGGEVRAMILGLAAFGMALGTLAIPHPVLLFGGLFLVCGPMFLVHSLAPGFLQSRAEANRGMVNGLYVSFYYGGGTLGSWLPGLLYRQWGWPALLASLLVMTGLALVLALGLRQGQPGPVDSAGQER